MRGRGRRLETRVHKEMKMKKFRYGVKHNPEIGNENGNGKTETPRISNQSWVKCLPMFAKVGSRVEDYELEF